MKKKCNRLALWSFLLALMIFGVSYVLYHYMLPGGFFTTVWQPVPGKPVVTILLAVLGVLFLFSGILSLLIGHIFYSEN